eukprot:2437786-Lingulodinium_polyedra.AAC.1
MAPKVKQIKVKQEPKVPCLAKMSSQEVNNAMRTRMKDAPPNIKEFFENNLKNLKTAKSVKKAEFVHNVLSGMSWSSTYFKRVVVAEHTDESSTAKQWKSYTQMLAIEPPEVLALMVSSGRVKTRPHSKLDLDDPEVQQLPKHMKLEYQHVEEEERDTTAIIERGENQDDRKPTEEEMKEQTEAEAVKPDVEMRKALRNWVVAEADITARLSKFAGN